MKHVTCQEVEPLLPATAAGALDQEDAQAVNDHLAGCSPCSNHLHQFEDTVEQLAYAVPQVAPPSQLRVRVMQAVLVTTQLGSDGAAYLPPLNGSRKLTASQPKRPRNPQLTLYTQFAPALLAACLVLLVGAALWMSTLSQQVNTLSDDKRQLQANASMLGSKLTEQDLILQLLQQPGAETMPFKLTSQSSDSAGRLIMAPGYKQVGLMITHVPTLPSGHVYKLWMLQHGDLPPTYAGILPPADRSGAITTTLDTPADPAQMAGFRITNEPDPTGLVATGPSWLEVWYK